MNQELEKNNRKMNPFFLMVLLYAVIALLVAFQEAIITLLPLPIFTSLKWIRVHFITLGMLTEAIFGSFALIIASKTNNKLKTSWLMFFSLNAGLVSLILGFSLANEFMIISGGSLIFFSTLLLFLDLIMAYRNVPKENNPISLLFYIIGLFYLFIGILVGTGLWLGWSEMLLIEVPLEVHIHANNWGFLSLVFTGLLIDYFPVFAKKPLGSEKQLKLILVGMILGAFGLVFGPWFNVLPLIVIGLLSHLAGTAILLALLIKSCDHKRKNVGMMHLVSSYAWMIAPVLVSPFVIFKITGFDLVEPNAPQALIYGWVLQFGFAMVPLLIRNYYTPGKERLGGNYISLVTNHIGALLLWGSIFVVEYSKMLHGLAYVFWAISIIPIAIEIKKIFDD